MKQLQDEGKVIDERSDDMEDDTHDGGDSSDVSLADSNDSLKDLISEISDVQIQAITWGEDE